MAKRYEINICPTGQHGEQDGDYCTECGTKMVSAAYVQAAIQTIDLRWTLVGQRERCRCDQEFGRKRHRYCPTCGKHIRWRFHLFAF